MSYSCCETSCWLTGSKMPPQSRQCCLPLFVTETRSPRVAHIGSKLAVFLPWSLSAGVTDAHHHQGKLPALSESRLVHLEDLSPQSLWFLNLFSWRLCTPWLCCSFHRALPGHTCPTLLLHAGTALQGSPEDRDCTTSNFFTLTCRKKSL